MNIYQLGIGDNLTNPDFFTGAIAGYLEAEKQLLLQLANPFENIIEAGCTKGRYACVAIQSAKNYFGIDIASHHIADALFLNKHNNRATFFCDDIHNLESIFSSNKIATDRSLLFFPFNSFGNLSDAATILLLIRRLNLSFAIFTYATNKQSTMARQQYYITSGFKHLKLLKDTSGIRFVNNEGLNTIAYYEEWFREIFTDLKFHFNCMPFGKIGKLYCNF